MKMKITLVRDPQFARYFRADFNVGDELFILGEYFSSSLGSDPILVFRYRQFIEADVLSGEPIGAEVIDGKIYLYHLYVSGLKKKPALTKEELLALVDKWFELVSTGAERIVITNDDGTFSLGIE